MDGQKLTLLTLLCGQLCALHYKRMLKLHLFPPKCSFYTNSVSFPLGCVFEATTMRLGAILVILGISQYALGKPLFISQYVLGKPIYVINPQFVDPR